MTKDIYSTLKKKKSGEVTISTKSEKPKPKTVKHHHKAKQVQQAPQPQQQQPQQQQQIQLSTAADVNRIKITCIDRRRAVQIYTLLAANYASWQRSTFDQKFNYFLQQTRASAFRNDANTIQAVLFQVIQVIDSMFAQAAAQQQAQVKKRI
jgi:hypothetical protein